MDAKGKTGSVELYERVVTIRHRGSVGWRASTGAVETRIPVSEILAIQLKSATLLGNGAIRFVVAAAGDPKHESATIVFTYRQNGAFEALAAEVARAIATPRLVAC